MPFDKLRTNGRLLIPLEVSLSNQDWNQLVQRFLNRASWSIEGQFPFVLDLPPTIGDRIE